MAVESAPAFCGISDKNAFLFQKRYGDYVCKRLYAGGKALFFKGRKEAEGAVSHGTSWLLLPDTDGIVGEYPAPFVKLTR